MVPELIINYEGIIKREARRRTWFYVGLMIMTFILADAVVIVTLVYARPDLYMTFWYLFIGLGVLEILSLYITFSCLDKRYVKKYRILYSLLANSSITQ